jgi:hypothetical protein
LLNFFFTYYNSEIYFSKFKTKFKLVIIITIMVKELKDLWKDVDSKEYQVKYQFILLLIIIVTNIKFFKIIIIF